jgi:hypothetical protein
MRIVVPPAGLGQRYTHMTAWLDENCGVDGWAITPSGTRGVLNDALSIYFADATLASAFVAGSCVGANVDTAGGVFQVREDEPEPRVGGAAQDAVSAGTPIGTPSIKPRSSGSRLANTAASSASPSVCFQRLLTERPTPERCIEAYYLQRTLFEGTRSRSCVGAS